MSMWQGMAVSGHHDLVEALMLNGHVPTLVLRRIATGRHRDLHPRAERRVSEREAAAQQVDPRRSGRQRR